MVVGCESHAASRASRIYRWRKAVSPARLLGEQLQRYRPMQLLVLREVDGRHAAVAERALEPVAAALHSGLAQPSPCFPWCPWCGLCFLGPGAGFGSTQVAVRAASEFAAEVSGSW